jgi:two-component system alkaline phosphatase synthesis response regulator PhoP
LPDLPATMDWDDIPLPAIHSEINREFGIMTKILAVDDEPDVLGLVKTKLEKAGFEVLLATNGLEAVEKAAREKPDLIVMDVMMPKLDGLTACTQIKREMGEEAPIIILLTARGQESDVVEGLSSGADDYMVKPFAPRELVARVNVALMKAGKTEADF